MSNTFSHNEMLIHIPLCTHKDPENILIFTNDATIKEETARHKKMNVTIMPIEKYEENISNAADKSFDIIIVDGKVTANKAFLAHLNRVSSDHGIFVFNDNRFLETLETTRALFDDLGEYFKIIMPYSYDDNKSATAKGTHFLASKFYHPTADFILNRTDLIDGLSYYNCDIHPASFAQPNYVRTALKGVARN